MKGVRGVEEGGVAVGDFIRESEHFRRNRLGLALGEQFDGFLCPNGPVAEQTAHDANRIRRNEIDHDVVIIARVERDVSPAAVFDRVDDIECLVAVERRDLDGDDVVNFGEFLPKRAWEHFSAHGGLEVKSDDGDDLRDFAAVSDHFGLGGRFEGGEAQKGRVVTELAEQCGFANGLRRESAHAADADEAVWESGFGFSRIRCG